MTAKSDIRIERLTGSALTEQLDAVARLRLKVFREWPYLYDGDMAYERDYLQIYRESVDAILVAAFDGDALIGASTGTPMKDHADDFAKALQHFGQPLDRIFYCAESVLLPQYRGRGLGHAFFEAREAHARALGQDFSAFCAVIRPEEHPFKPKTYRPLDEFWRKRGYAPVEGAIAHFPWKERGQSAQTDHRLQFWMRAL